MLIVFDFDSTLLNGESIDILARRYKVEAAVSYITKEAMEGKLDFFESLTKRVAFLEDMPLSLVKESIENDFKLMNGAIECVKTLRDRGHIVVCFSGGFRIITEHFKDTLGLNATFSNILHCKDSKLTGKVGGDMMFGDSKGYMMQNLQGVLGLDRTQCAAIGDGANDISMFNHADIRIAFCAKEILKSHATHCIDKKDLKEVLNIVP
ncbi:phosphoserine phosphatase SerB [Helicobacter saguini]|uniref:Phosphoserine phosphatase n=1 Tax=Helicobacter saguini TaxID=1548018 RepID=A0A347VNM0_9HELI|nr:phosphoserine phosphatase SerB [Helicobacter saguini]MWV61712.1 phosphoserine phosphatase SerB [Helicobacter saguini]MWV67616.1 phosphoserine phosphatase SerB [Helicobacter saguini]MWV69967.1 phosphoserine phosphatase SerB [Helicobacter saguini]MWV72819.1 phosphoserine phosphatase SerB [Helicobacter saguini]TLD92363.1 phosphoserine phosphatase SerB [Helicobacter saguini]